jgi:CheY-like chemotaxis protein
MSAHTEPPLVLIVDDVADNRDILSDFLALSGFRVAGASTGREAVDCAVALIPDAILMDLALPDVDGWEATRRLKRDARTRHIPVIALTGHVLANHARKASDAGCEGFITKPCEPEAIVAELTRVLSRHRRAG